MLELLLGQDVAALQPGVGAVWARDVLESACEKSLTSVTVPQMRAPGLGVHGCGPTGNLGRKANGCVIL